MEGIFDIGPMWVMSDLPRATLCPSLSLSFTIEKGVIGHATHCNGVRCMSDSVSIKRARVFVAVPLQLKV